MIAKPLFRIQVTLLLLLWWQGLVFAQNYLAQFNSYSVEDGLSHRFINVIEQDEAGFIWIGTNYGLNRFDGQEFKVYQLVNVITQERQVSNIQFDSKGRLFLRFNRGTGDAYNVFDPHSGALMSVESAIGQALPERVKKDMIVMPLSDGTTLFLGSEKDSMYFLQADQRLRAIPFKRINNEKLDAVSEYSPGLFLVNTTQTEGGHCRALVMDANGKIKQEYQFDSPNCIILHYSGDSLYVLSAGDNNIYACFGGKTPERLPYKASDIKKVHSRSNRMATHFLFSVPQQPEILQLRNYEGRLLQEIALSHVDKFNAFDISTSFLDKAGAIWFGNFNYFSLGYIQMRQTHFQRYLYEYRTHKNTLQSTRGIATYKDSLLFVNSSEDCFQIQLKTGAIKPLNFKKDINGMAHLSGLILDHDDLWMVSSMGYLLAYHIPTATQKYFPVLDKKTGNAKPLFLHKSRAGEMLIGGKYGLYYLDGATAVVLPYKGNDANTTLASSYVEQIHENEEGTWFCTSTGLYWKEQKTGIIRHYHQEGKGANFLPYNQLSWLHEDSDGIFWLATKGGGLIRWNRKQQNITRFTTREGLSHDVIYAIFEDEKGRLWMSSDRGIMQFDKKTRGVVTYLLRDGITHEEFNTFSYHQRPDGTIYFGGLNGVTAFHPQNFETQSSQKAAFLISGIEIKNAKTGAYEDKLQAWQKSGKITIQANENSLIIKLALLDYTAPKQIRFAYKIVGIDQDWTIITQGKLPLHQLPYGTTRLLLRAQGPDGYWVDYKQAIEIEVLKPFYLKIPFLLGAVFVFILIIYLAVRLRVGQLERRKKELEQIVKERTAKIEEDRQLIEQQAEALKALDRIKSRFFANVSHELRTPLTLILGPLSYLLDHPEALEKEAVQKQLLLMQRNGKNLLQLVEEIMDLSKQEARRLELNEAVVLPSEFFQQCFAAFLPQFHQLGIEGILEIAPNIEALPIWLDIAKFQKILNNYLGNALKFTPRGGQIRVKIDKKAELLRISVSDTGKGIHPKDLPHIFERFYQARQEDTTLYGGTGIGLALVAEYAQLMQGSAYAESELGKGSSFYFECPLKPYNTEESAQIKATTDLILEAEQIASIGSDFTILVVEDNDDMRNFIAEVLSPHYKVISARNGLEGFAILQQQPDTLHLVISDVMMPEMDGFELLKKIKSDNKLWQIPVIMLTALHAEKDKLNALSIGVDDYLTKPFSVAELLARTQNLLYNYHQRLHWQVASETLTATEPLEMEEEAPEDHAADMRWVKEIEDKVRELIPNHSPSVDELAQFFFLSTRQFHRRLKRITGLTPAKFIREVQLEKARSLLETGKMATVFETAYFCGFETPDTFSRLYKQRFGKSPSEFL